MREPQIAAVVICTIVITTVAIAMMVDLAVLMSAHPVVLP